MAGGAPGIFEARTTRRTSGVVHVDAQTGPVDDHLAPVVTFAGRGGRQLRLYARWRSSPTVVALTVCDADTGLPTLVQYTRVALDCPRTAAGFAASG